MPTDQIMLVTDTGQVIRCPVDDIRVAARKTQGVVLFRVGDDEKVVSVSLVGESDNGDSGDNGDGGDASDEAPEAGGSEPDRKSTRLNSSPSCASRMPSSA